MSVHKQAFMSLFKETARYHHRYKVFSDFVTMAGISLHNSVMFDEELEAKYLRIVAQYEKDDALRMSQLLGEVVLGLEQEPSDFLGSVYMELELGSDGLGQYFTPYCVSKMMAELNCGNLTNSLQSKPFITLSEPACGSGGMIIAYCEAMLNRGFNPQKQLFVSCVDIDELACMMAYIQLSLLGIPAEVVHGNTLTLDIYRSYKTPAYCLGFWEGKLASPISRSVHALEAVLEPDMESSLEPLVQNIPMLTVKEQMELFV
ncbi:N-6 DNA methylase [Vibrio rotiferianus]|uniref:N-6 DNA methylase n=1 Tax=Vibrio rotiferianus TaxID=190895 RepID=UPI0005ED9A03|nr:N-6 DNA methylase [Vibrio rotiferianus]